MAQLIKVGRTIINLDHVVYAEFDTSSDGEPVALFCLTGMEPQWESEEDDLPVMVPNFRAFTGPVARRLEEYLSDKIEEFFEDGE